MKWHHQITRFGVTGGLGFLVDSGILHVAMNLGTGFYWGRMISFLTAATFTWLLNRNVTFVGTKGTGQATVQWVRYIGAMLVGGSLNYAVSAWIYRDFHVAWQWPVLAVAAGSLAGLLLNFVSAKFFVFK